MTTLLRNAVLCAAFTLGACGGGSHPVTAPAGTAAGPPVKATLTITIPKRTPNTSARGPRFISPSTLSLAVTVNGQTPPTVLNVAAGQSSYTASVSAPTGSDTFVVSLFDEPGAVGNLLGQGTTTAKVSAASPQVAVNVLGKVMFVTADVVPQAGSIVTIKPVGIDGDGGVIAGTYLNPIVLTDVSAGSNLNGAGTTATVTAPGSTVTFNWTTAPGSSGCGAGQVNLQAGSVNLNSIPVPYGNVAVSSMAALPAAIGGAASGDVIVVLTGGTVTIGSTIAITNKNVAVCGPVSASAPAVIDGGGTTQIFNISGASANVSIFGLTLQHGNGAGKGGGGAIFSAPTAGAVFIYAVNFSANVAGGQPGGALVVNGSSAPVTVTACTFTGNQAASSSGGAIANGGSLTVNNSQFTNNADGLAAGFGGAIYSVGPSLAINSDAFTGNTAANGGGAIFTQSATTISGSSFVSNQATGGSGGGAVYATSAATTITNSTFFGNSTSSFGGAVIAATSGTVTIDSATFSNNSAASDGGTLALASGAITIKNSILDGGSPNDLGSGSYSLTGYAMIATPGTALVSGGTLVPGPPKFGAYGLYGGPTKTLPLLAGSPAIDAIPNGSCTQTQDQRGLPRPRGAGCDLGAFEYP